MEQTNAIQIPFKRDRNLMPKFSTTVWAIFNVVEKIEHVFMQTLVDANAKIIVGRDYFELMAYDSVAMLKIREGYVYLECLATPKDFRGQGSATKLMTALIEAAKETNTIIRLTTAVVSWNRGSAIIPPMAIGHGSVTKGKIPVNKLKDFYKKFGFVVTEHVKGNEYEMEYVPPTASN